MIALAAALLLAAAQEPVEGIEPFRVKSELLSDFLGRETYLEAGVVVPPELEPGDPVCFNIHGFGGSHEGAWTQGAQLRGWMEAGVYPRMLYVYPNANGPFGHTGFADSDNNGPWARAFVEELLPAVESFFGAGGSREARFLTGHSSGGWAALWLQVHHPDVFGGAWASAPDALDFRDMSGVDLYAFDNLFEDPEGKPIPAVRLGGRYVMTARQVAGRKEYLAQLLAFEAAFSPRGDDGRPSPLFDRESGAIDRAVAEAWSRYDLRRIVAARADELRAPLDGRLHVYVGEWDTVGLDGPARLFDAALAALEIEATFVYAPERDHFDLLQPHPELWPEALLTRVHREMRASFDAAR